MNDNSLHFNKHPELLEVQFRYRARHLAWDRIDAHLSRFPSQPGAFNKSAHVTQDVIPEWTALLTDLEGRSPLPSPLAALEHKALAKWVGPQGGCPSRGEVQDGARRYYTNAVTPGTLHFPSLPEKVRAQLWGEFARSGIVYKPLTPVQIYRLYKGDHASNSGLTTWADRRLRESIATACSDAARFTTGDPTVGGSRRQRNKNSPPRNIFMSSQADLLRYGKLFRFLHDAMASSDTVLWRGDRYAERTVSAFLARHPKAVWIGSDYETLDTWVTVDHALWITDVLASILLLPESWRSAAHTYWLSAFRSELILPGYLVMEGWHTLFSGLPETNDLESWLNLAILLMWVYEVAPKAELHRDFEVIVLGDDSLILIDPSFLLIPMEEIPSSLANFAWANFRLRANEEKQDVRMDGLAFCKRVYWRGGKTRRFEDFSAPASAYPISLVMNSLCNPEDFDGSPSEFLTRTLQLLDNAWGHPYWRAAASFVWQRVHPVRKYWMDGVHPADQAPGINWRFRLYGERWDLASSPTGQLFATYR